MGARGESRQAGSTSTPMQKQFRPIVSTISLDSYSPCKSTFADQMHPPHPQWSFEFRAAQVSHDPSSGVWEHSQTGFFVFHFLFFVYLFFVVFCFSFSFFLFFCSFSFFHFREHFLFTKDVRRI